MNAKKAIVLAAGLGTRLRPLTATCPKPLMPVWGETMLGRVVNLLRSWGVTDIAVNCHYLHEQIEQWCSQNGCRAIYEPQILGTGGVLNPLRDWIANDDFFLVNGDIVVEGIDQCPFNSSLWSKDTIGQCLVTEEGPRTIEVECESRYVTCWQSPDSGQHGTYTYCGIALLRPKILQYIETSGFSSIVQAYEKAMMDGCFIRAAKNESLLWTDAGTIDSYINLNTSGEDSAFEYLPQLAEAAKACGRENEKISFLSSRGSDRCFFSVGLDAIAIIYDDASRRENSRYASHAAFLSRHGINVPAVLADIPQRKTLVLENAGSERKMTLEEYAKVIECLAAFNSVNAKGVDLEMPFNDELWQWERDLFAKHCLSHRFNMELSGDVLAELKNVSAKLSAEPLELVHRDFQSTNILWKMGKISFIDFQGMRLGPAVYDLASLLYDPYAKLSARERTLLAQYYGKIRNMASICEILPYAAVQRLIQALGAFCRLTQAGKTDFEKFIMPALENLLTVADEAGLDAVGALAEDLIAIEAKRHSTHCDHGPHCSCGGNHERN